MKIVSTFLVGVVLAATSARSAIVDVSNQASILLETGSILKVEFSLQIWKDVPGQVFPFPSLVQLQLLGLPPAGPVENGEFVDSDLDIFLEAGDGVLAGDHGYKAMYADFNFHDGSTVLYQGPGFSSRKGFTFAPGSPYPSLVFGPDDKYTFLLRNSGTALTIGLPNIPASSPNTLGALQESGNGFSVGAGQPTGVWLLTGANAVIVPEPGTWSLVIVSGMLAVLGKMKKSW